MSRSLALERLGPVNHAALEEYEVESTRLAELSAQKADLDASLAQILETIRTINTTSSERFQEAFAAVNFNFGQVFQRLFHGGTASMHLLDEEDPLDSGLEIMAQPPGKRNQTIGLLSGGEKALTAIALLVAIFKYKPSPFCILDEVDASLDEANIDRFTSLLVELSEETQFVLITHNKRTMETAQALYGVTQEEPGVSKLVSSVRLARPGSRGRRSSSAPVRLTFPVRRVLRRQRRDELVHQEERDDHEADEVPELEEELARAVPVEADAEDGQRPRRRRSAKRKISTALCALVGGLVAHRFASSWNETLSGF